MDNTEPRMILNGVNYSNEELAKKNPKKIKNPKFERLHPRGLRGKFAKKAVTTKRPAYKNHWGEGSEFAPSGEVRDGGGLLPNPQDFEARFAKPVAGEDRTTINNLLKIESKDPNFHKLVGSAADIMNEIMSFDKKLAKVTIREEVFKDDPDGSKEHSGQYDADTRILKINKHSRDKVSTLIHEIIHHFDAQAIGDNESWLSDNPEFKQAFHKTKMWKDMNKTIQDGIFNSKNMTDLQNRRWSGARYWMSPAEGFARAITQYIAKKSNNKAFKEEIKRDKTAWPNNDFAPLERYFNQFFKDRRMRR